MIKAAKCQEHNSERLNSSRFISPVPSEGTSTSTSMNPHSQFHLRSSISFSVLADADAEWLPACSYSNLSSLNRKVTAIVRLALLAASLPPPILEAPFRALPTLVTPSILSRLLEIWKQQWKTILREFYVAFKCHFIARDENLRNKFHLQSLIPNPQRIFSDTKIREPPLNKSSLKDTRDRQMNNIIMCRCRCKCRCRCGGCMCINLGNEACVSSHDRCHLKGPSSSL
ncbi:hypothetical protein KQX54_004905 [Cotesia glomerata]|uniref:Uncharacterized protein n=1 Tax=Cotesia glomerata TaxID=32391 RepID=A0AAV7IB51_COTGL|nr:hypothetical protein KQX54_004905 [Cotesia glomerata]